MSRRATVTTERNTIRAMCYFYQWVYWRTRDPEIDAIRGRHDRNEAPLFDLLSAFGELRKKLREKIGDDGVRSADWLFEMSDEDILRDLPAPKVGRKRFFGKTTVAQPELGPRPKAPKKVAKPKAAKKVANPKAAMKVANVEGSSAVPE